MSKAIMSGREFIKMMRPILGITQGAIVSMTVTARHDDAARIDIECIAKSDCSVDIVDATTNEDKPEKRRFIVEVTEDFGQNLTRPKQSNTITPK